VGERMEGLHDGGDRLRHVDVRLSQSGVAWQSSAPGRVGGIQWDV
jgi:hypothetical protein